MIPRPTQAQAPNEVRELIEDYKFMQDTECPLSQQGKCFQTNCLNCKRLK